LIDRIPDYFTCPHIHNITGQMLISGIGTSQTIVNQADYVRIVPKADKQLKAIFNTYKRTQQNWTLLFR